MNTQMLSAVVPTGAFIDGNRVSCYAVVAENRLQKRSDLI